MKITAAHDFNDYEVYKRHSDVVPLINLFTADARMVDESTCRAVPRARPLRVPQARGG